MTLPENNQSLENPGGETLPDPHLKIVHPLCALVNLGFP